MATSDGTQGFESQQISSSNLNGALYLDPAGVWRFKYDGSIAEHVRSARLGALLPQFFMVRRYGRSYYSLPYDWRNLYNWQHCDRLAGEAVDALICKGEQALVRGPNQPEDSLTGRHQARKLGALVKVQMYDEMADRPVASWSAKDAEAVYAKAQARILYLDEKDVETEINTVYQLFMTRDAVQRFGSREAEKSVQAWLHICHHLRLAFAAGTSRYRLWLCEHAMSQAWKALPSNFAQMSKVALHQFAEQFVEDVTHEDA